MLNTTKRFMNDDYKIKPDCRKAVRISKNQLMDKMRKYCVKYSNEYDPDDPDDINNEEMLIYFICRTDKIRADMKYDIGYPDNVDPGWYDTTNTLIGCHTLDNGLTFYGFRVNSDENYPVFSIIYYDGKQLRLFMPTYGNTVNRDFKCAFHEEYNSCDQDFSQTETKLINKYIKMGILKNKQEWDNYPDDFRFEHFYWLQYGLDFEKYWEDNYDYNDCNWNAIQKEIEQHITVI